MCYPKKTKEGGTYAYDVDGCRTGTLQHTEFGYKTVPPPPPAMELGYNTVPRPVSPHYSRSSTTVTSRIGTSDHAKPSILYSHHYLIHKTSSGLYSFFSLQLRDEVVVERSESQIPENRPQI